MHGRLSNVLKFAHPIGLNDEQDGPRLYKSAMKKVSPVEVYSTGLTF